MFAYTDQLGKVIRLAQTPQRIVSLVPSQTELLHYLGLSDSVVGITKFCIHPNEWYRNKMRIGGTKTTSMDSIASLHPDLIIANKEENVQEQVEALENLAPVWTSDINTVGDALQMIQSIGDLTGKAVEAGQLVKDIQTSFAAVRQKAANSHQQKIKTAYLIWKDPYMAAGGDTFIHSLMEVCGFENVLSDHNRYPETRLTELASRQTELVLLSSEPYPFSQKHLIAIQAALPDCRILLVDGEMFSWYGSRMLAAGPYFEELIAKLSP